MFGVESLILCKQPIQGNLELLRRPDLRFVENGTTYSLLSAKFENDGQCFFKGRMLRNSRVGK